MGYKCFLCEKCESRIRYNKNIETTTRLEEIKNILQHACEILQYVQESEFDLPKEKAEYLISGIRSTIRILG